MTALSRLGTGAVLMALAWTGSPALAEETFEIEVTVTKVEATGGMDERMGREGADFYMEFDSPDGRRYLSPRIDNTNVLTGDLLERWSYGVRASCDADEACTASVTMKLCDKNVRRRQCDTVDVTPDLGEEDDGILTLTIDPRACTLEMAGASLEGTDEDGACRIEAASQGTGSGPDRKADLAFTVTAGR